MHLDSTFPWKEHSGLRQLGFFTVRGPCRRQYCGTQMTAQTLACRWVKDWTPTLDCGSTAARGVGLAGMVRSGENAVIYQGKGVSIRSIPAFHALDGPCPPIRSFDTCPFRLLPSVF